MAKGAVFDLPITSLCLAVSDGVMYGRTNLQKSILVESPGRSTP